MLLHRSLLAVAGLCLGLAAPVLAQVDEPASYLREDRTASPPLMPWQRNLEDALALSRATGKPLLLCVNMDGELASEALAADRYRDPDFVALADGFIPLLASPDRHDALDHTSRGVRIPDSKFGRVTNSEHMEIEPELFERWFDGRRVAPRHVGVSPDGEVLFDLYLLTDLSKIDAALAEFGKFEPVAEAPTIEGAGAEVSAQPEPPPELSEGELLDSPDAAHRDLLEARFVAASTEDRVRLAGAALSPTRTTQHPELLRLALRDPEPVVRAAGITTLAAYPRGAALLHFSLAAQLLGDAPSEERDALLSALQRFATDAPEDVALSAMQHARALRAVGAGSEVVDVEAWLLGSTSGASSEPVADVAWDERLARIEERLAEDPDDPDLNVLFARNGRAYALDLMRTGGDPSFVLEDVRSAADRARNVRPDDGLANGLFAWSSYMLGDFASASEAARRSMRALQAWSSTPLAVDVVDVLADSGARLVYEQLGRREALSENLLADSAAAHEVLIRHPMGTEAQALHAFQLLGAVDLRAAQRRAIELALERWPQSGTMHEWYRWVVLRDEGPDGLLRAYDGRRLAGIDRAQRSSFAGLAKLQAAERRIEERDTQRALEDYRLAFQDLEDAVGASASVGSFARWYQAQARAGRARLFLESGRLDEALAEILLCFTFETPAHDEPDARGVRPRETLRAVRDALLAAGRESDAAALERYVEPPQAADAEPAEQD
ncbi:MAG: hypothetical protein H6831_16655 [Planctomycetes bacterium]|nr:hypothetical protein [Planctomycetota bacterium]MCB9906033.1 hypothetical protein [Planctomycetota bacterium]